MKKRTKVILGVIIGVVILLLILYSVFMTLGVYFASQEINNLRTEYSGSLEKSTELNKEVLDEYSDMIVESGRLIPLEAFGRLIDENAVASFISGESAIIRLGMGEKTAEIMKEEIQHNIGFLPSALETAELKTCIICVVDKEEDVLFGYTFHSDGTSTLFLSEKF